MASPGHSVGPDLSLNGMRMAVQALITALGIVPAGHHRPFGGCGHRGIVGHGRRGQAGPHGGDHQWRLSAHPGGAGSSPPLAKALFAAPLSANLFAAVARGGWFGDNLLTATGSQIDNTGAVLYRRLLTSSGHVRGALGMMAAWDLTRFDALLAALPVPAHTDRRKG
jgi:magnesium chelatase accessory protein